ncbi:MAG: hypothetical protein COU30_02955 [Candidatus Magasanikbacteria bacterium CG10_big_fil_rev_8_21_14_0_10_38_6]|uniref:Rod shape-determining protein RodA n=1 Tax=Candidatus Magasanikbacteria bacterium CG10_big_fil_rev_8_21_14_0_10_38_6 TaxID=1974647 RepID=A0A2M6P0U0_9BACT|nr:MAG: hypothetical protein COU30_02955 [Candidatus Magasanikbacteria bacterium CG10_big_fil_rev_8_21_14_0_10_38_6]
MYSQIRHHDWVLSIVVFILISLGLTAIYSVDLSRGDTLIYFPTQILAFFLGACVLFIVGLVHVSFYRFSAKFFYAFAFVLLVSVLFFGVTIRGTTGWFRVAGFSFQPAEFAKVGLAIFLAWWISLHGRKFYRWQFVLTSGAITFVLVGLVMMQPDLGSASVLFCVWFGLLIFTGTKKRYIAGLILLFLGVSIFSWFFVFKPYQKDRLLTFLQPDDPTRALTTAYNVNQSLIAVGAGQLFGRGLGFGSQSQLHFLPEAQTDFIFAVIAEELGFIGVCVLLFLYFLLLWRLVRIIDHCSDDFSAYLVAGVALIFFVQLLVNVGGALSILPVTGVTLPFVSYGGSSLILNCFLIGLVQSVAASESFGARDQFSHGMIG